MGCHNRVGVTDLVEIEARDIGTYPRTHRMAPTNTEAKKNSLPPNCRRPRLRTMG